MLLHNDSLLLLVVVSRAQAYDAVKADVFSAGAMLFMMLTGVPAFNVPSRTDAGFLTVVWRGDVQGFLRYYDLPLLSADVSSDCFSARKSSRRPVDRHSGGSAEMSHFLRSPIKPSLLRTCRR